MTDPIIKATDLQPGDLFLSLGDSSISRAIRELDGGAYSHAAVWTGEAVIESTLPSVAESPLASSLAHHPRVYVDVFRHQNVANRQADIVREARAFIGRPYAHGELVLGALLVATSTWIPGKQWQIQYLMNVCGFNFLMQEDLAPKAGELVTCTQLAVLSYCRAGVPISIRPTAPARINVDELFHAGHELLREKVAEKKASVGARGVGNPAQPDVDADAAAWRAFVQRVGARYEAVTGLPPAPPIDPNPLRLSHKPPLFEAGLNWRAERVTPRHLQTSPTLRRLGRLDTASI